MDEVKDKLAPLCDYLEGEIKAELEKQGHIATGNLRDSIKVVLAENEKGFSIEGRASSIAKYVDWGRKPGGRRVPVDALLAWIRVRGITATGMSERSLAWAIQHSIWKNGIPTDSSKKETHTKFVTRTLQGNRERIKNDIKEASEFFIGFEIDNMIMEIKSRVYVS